MKIIQTDKGPMAKFTIEAGTIIPYENGYWLTDHNQKPLINEISFISSYGKFEKEIQMYKTQKVLATFGFSLEGVDKIEKVDVERLAIEEVERRDKESNNKLTRGHADSEFQLAWRYLKIGYEMRAQTHKWTDEDVERAIYIAIDRHKSHTEYEFYENQISKILQFLEVPERLLLPVVEMCGYDTCNSDAMCDNCQDPVYKLKSENGKIYLP